MMISGFVMAPNGDITGRAIRPRFRIEWEAATSMPPEQLGQ